MPYSGVLLPGAVASAVILGDMTTEPCAMCARETAVGSALFSGRGHERDRKTGLPVFLCAACTPDSADHGEKPSDSRLGIIELADTFPR